MIMTPLCAHRVDRLNGTVRVPGDKSISHRALMFAGLAVGETRIEGLLEGEDVRRTAAAMRALGSEVERDDSGLWRVVGRGLGALTEPQDVLDMGNSGTGARLLLGILASHPLSAVMTGDASLRRRPMGRVTEPLSATGARFITRSGGRLPITVIGTGEALPLAYRLPVASAQVKSAVLLAGLNARGDSVIVEPTPTRDHSERMLSHFGATLEIGPLVEDGDGTDESAASGGGRRIVLKGQPELVAADVTVPGDPSSAAFPMVAATILAGSAISIPGVCLNPTRSGLIETLREMGADIAVDRPRVVCAEPVADLRVRSADLTGIEVPAWRAPSMIDEYPILAVAAAFAEGPTVMRGLGELRVKESDRLARVAKGLAACGVEVEEGPDWLIVSGQGRAARPRGGALLATALDHRLAMSFLVLGLGAEQPVTIDDASPIDTSFPGFAELMGSLGADLRAVAAPGST
jgi:3-phosphoshikimate 1-carboxyvinyltransferase